MTHDTLLIHDTRTVGVITAAVLARVLPRKARTANRRGKIRALFGRGITSSTREFWLRAKSLIEGKLQENPCETVMLCCVGFDDLNESACQETLKWLADRVQLVIYTHKWPDGYTRAGFDVKVSPHAIAEEFGGYIEPVEWELLRASLVVAREADPETISKADKHFADQLANNIWPAHPDHGEEQKHWEWLIKNLGGAVHRIKRGDPTSRRQNIESPEIDDRCVIYKLEEHPPVSIEKILEAQVDNPNFPNPGIAVGLVNWGSESGSRAYLLRPWRQRKYYPSIDHLLEAYGGKYDLQLGWVGNQDAMHVRVTPAHSGYETLLQTLPSKLRGFCNEVAARQFGARQPHAWAARFIHKQASEVLEKLDLFGTFVRPQRGGLFFDPEGTQIVLSQSNRSEKPIIHTLTLRLVVNTPKAAAFLFGHGGYNFTKLEMSLDGALAAIAKIPSLWFGATTVPSKLRIDADLRLPLESVGDAFKRLEEVAPLKIGDAIELGVVEKESVIARALADPSQPLVIFRGSETIGPSVQYQILAHSIVHALYQKLGRKINVLELFAGSGYCSRKLTKPDGMARIVCVDASVRAETAILDTAQDVIWLRALIDQVLSADGIYYRPYDVILMDPPHGMLLEILFGGGLEGSVVERASKLAHGLVIYVGHDSQASRCRAVAQALKRWYRQVTEWRVGSERLISAGYSSSATEPAWEYEDVIDAAATLAKQGVKEFDQHWPAEIVPKDNAVDGRAQLTLTYTDRVELPGS
jgi:hypothetical protein